MFEFDHYYLSQDAAGNASELSNASCVLRGLLACLPVEELDLTPLAKDTFRPCQLGQTKTTSSSFLAAECDLLMPAAKPLFLRAIALRERKLDPNVINAEARSASPRPELARLGMRSAAPSSSFARSEQIRLPANCALKIKRRCLG